jgi:hypothetical protein
VRNPAALFSSRQRRMSTVKIGSGCLVWVDSVEKVSKGWNPGSKLKPLSSLVGNSEEWLVSVREIREIRRVSLRKASGFPLARVLRLVVE